jgi:uncharacterized coiled-coil protein SlyX
VLPPAAKGTIMSEKLESETPVAAATTCSRLGDLLESLDSWIEDSLKGSKPIGLTLCRARVTITDQHDRIGEIFDALEHQNKEVARLREQVKRLRGALSMWRMEGPDSNACWCDACLAMHGAHPAHSEECNAAREAMDSSANSVLSRPTSAHNPES